MVRFLLRSSATAVMSPAVTSGATRPVEELVRQPADRAAHLDDQHLVFWNADRSRASAAQLSEAATAWHHAVAQQPALASPELPRLARA